MVQIERLTMRYIIIMVSVLIELLPCTGYAQNPGKKNNKVDLSKARIEVQSDLLDGPDSVELLVYDCPYKDMQVADAKSIRSKIDGDRSVVYLDNLTRPVYCKFIQPPKKRYEYKFDLTDLFLLEPGDNLHINVVNKKVFFSGRGAQKCIIWQKIDSMFNVEKWKPSSLDDPKDPPAVFKKDKVYDIFKSNIQNWDSAINAALLLINKNRLLISTKACDLLKLDAIGQIGHCFYYSNYFSASLTVPSSDLPDFILAWKAAYQAEKWNLRVPYNDTLMTISRYYADYLFRKEHASQLFKIYHQDMGKLKAPIDSFNSAVSRYYTGLVRQKLLTENIFNDLYSSEAIPDALTYVKEKATFEPFKKAIDRIAERITIGSMVPDTDLYDSTGKIFRISDFKGKTVVIHFWFTGCGACKAVGEGMRRCMDSLNQRDDLVFLTVSVDADMEKWKQSLKGGEYTSANEINLYTGGKGTSDELIQYYGFDGFPQMLVIDKSGRLISAIPKKPWVDNAYFNSEFIKYIRSLNSE